MKKIVLVAVIVSMALQTGLFAFEDSKTNAAEKRSIIGSIGHALIMYVGLPPI